MLDLATLQKYDLKKMYEVYDMWPELAREAYYNDLGNLSFNDVNHIVFAGMGGSGAIGDIMNSIFSNSNIHVNVIKGYILPKTVNEKSLVVVSSISGNTIEALQVLKSAKDLGCKLITFSSGGKMEEFCNKNKINFVKVQEYNSPRASLTVFLYSMLNVLNSIIPINSKIVEESLIEIKNLREKINSSNLTDTNDSLRLANWVKEIPLIYFPGGLKSAAIRFKNALQENSKSHAIIEEVVESCHNGIVAWENPSKIQPIFLRGKDDYCKTIELWDILKEFFSKKEIEFFDILSPNGHILTKLVYLIYLLDYATIYLSVMKGIDPSPVKSIDFIKKQIKDDVL